MSLQFVGFEVTSVDGIIVHFVVLHYRLCAAASYVKCFGEYLRTWIFVCADRWRQMLPAWGSRSSQRPHPLLQSHKHLQTVDYVTWTCMWILHLKHNHTCTHWDTLTSSPPALPAACWSSAGCHQCRLCSVVESMKQWEDDRERGREGRTLICFCSRGEMPRLSCDLDIWLNLYGFKIRSSPMLHSKHVVSFSHYCSNINLTVHRCLIPWKPILNYLLTISYKLACKDVIFLKNWFDCFT